MAKMYGRVLDGNSKSWEASIRFVVLPFSIKCLLNAPDAFKLHVNFTGFRRNGTSVSIHCVLPKPVLKGIPLLLHRSGRSTGHHGVAMGSPLGSHGIPFRTGFGQYFFVRFRGKMGDE